MTGLFTWIGYILTTVFLFSGSAAGLKRIQSSRGWNSDEALIFVFGAIVSVIASAAFFAAYHEVRFVVPIAVLLAAPVGFMAVYALYYSMIATFWALKNFFKGLWAAIEWVANSGRPQAKKSAKSDSSAAGQANQPTPPAKRDSIFPDGF